MLVKELIAALQQEDPDTEVCVGNRPIHFIEGVPAYYDGPLQVLVQDKANPYYNITGAKILHTGRKVQVHILSIEDALLEDPEMTVECTTDRDKTRADQWRKEAREARDEAIKWHKEYLAKKMVTDV